jgi:hypothetical protein
MRKASWMGVICVAVLSTPSTARAVDLWRVLALGGGDAFGTRACCSSDAGCGCEASCASEPGCGCGESCGVDGRRFAGETWTCCRECGPPICECTGQHRAGGGSCGGACGCGDACEPGCGCEPACGCDRAGGCQGRNCKGTFGGIFFGSCCGRVICCVDKFCGCTGCDGELYWNEWHNDPPKCCDPCDQCGNWIGPAHGGYRAPYDHPYNVAGRASAPNLAAKTPGSAPLVARRPQDAGKQAANPFRSQTRGITRKPSTGRGGTYHR